MSAIVCGKRSNFFEESPSSPPVSKRIRCSTSPCRTLSPSGAASSSYLFSDPSSPIDYLVALFPDMEKQFLERVLEESGDYLDSAIKRLNGLHLSASAATDDISQNADKKIPCLVTNNGTTGPPEELPAGSNLPLDGTQWVELLVREVAGASNIEDAKARVSLALEALEKSICANAAAEATQRFEKENFMLKQQLEVLKQENAILKRAVSIQNQRQKEFEEIGQELLQSKQLVSQDSQTMNHMTVCV